MCFSCPGGFENFICTYFTCLGGSGGVQLLTNLCNRAGPLLKHLRLEASRLVPRLPKLLGFRDILAEWVAGLVDWWAGGLVVWIGGWVVVVS